MAHWIITRALAGALLGLVFYAAGAQAASAHASKCRTDVPQCIRAGDPVGRGVGHVQGPPVSIFPPRFVR